MSKIRDQIRERRQLDHMLKQLYVDMPTWNAPTTETGRFEPILVGPVSGHDITHLVDDVHTHAPILVLDTDTKDPIWWHDNIDIGDVSLEDLLPKFPTK